MFDVGRSMFDVRFLTFDVGRSTFDVRLLTFDAGRSMFDVGRSMFDVRFLTLDVRFLILDTEDPSHVRPVPRRDRLYICPTILASTLAPLKTCARYADNMIGEVAW